MAVFYLFNDIVVLYFICLSSLTGTIYTDRLFLYLQRFVFIYLQSDGHFPFIYFDQLQPLFIEFSLTICTEFLRAYFHVWFFTYTLEGIE